MTMLHHLNTSQLEVSTIEDPMELSSDVDRRPIADEDIDVDVELTGDHPNEHEDEYMIEYVDSVADQKVLNETDSQGEIDDEMIDDGYSSGAAEGTRSVYDEDLLDADDLVQDDGPTLTIETIGETTLQHTSELIEHTSHIEGDQITDNVHHQEPDEPQAISRDDEVSITALPVDENDVIADTRLAPTEVQDHASPLDFGGRAEVVDQDDSPLPPNWYEVADTETNSVTRIDGLQEKHEIHTPLPDHGTDTSPRRKIISQSDMSLQRPIFLHPIIVVYQDNEISLFPPLDQDQEHSQTYFLQDETYAYGSFKKLLSACRLVLAGSISEQDELEIRLDDLGLQICESNAESSTATLVQLLDIYLQLQQNDGVENPDPLYIVLQTKIRFSSRLEYLLTAVAESRGFSEISVMDRIDEQVQQHDSLKEEGSSHQDAELSPSESEYERREVTSHQEHDFKKNKNDNFRQEVQSKKDVRHPPALEVIAIAAKNISQPILPDDDTEQVEDLTDSNSSEQEIVAMQAEELLNSRSNPEGNDIASLQQMPLIFDDGDLIDYEDEEDESFHELSTESSTLQGDGPEATASEFQASINNMLSSEDSKDAMRNTSVLVPDQQLYPEPSHEFIPDDPVPDSAFLGADDNQSTNFQDEPNEKVFEEQPGSHVAQEVELQTDLDEHLELQKSPQGQIPESTVGNLSQAALEATSKKDMDDEDVIPEIPPKLDSEKVEHISPNLPDDLEENSSFSSGHEQKAPASVGAIEIANTDISNKTGRHETQTYGSNDTVNNEVEFYADNEEEFDSNEHSTRAKLHNEEADEITYEDDDDIEPVRSSTELLQSLSPNSKSSKRARNTREEEGVVEENCQDVKRLRSG